MLLLTKLNTQTNKDTMKYNRTIQKILTQHHVDKFKDAANKAAFLFNYAKETDKVKKIEMLREANRQGWI